MPAGTSARVANAAGMCCYRCRWAAGRDLCPLHQPLRPSPSPAPAAAEDSRAARKPLSRPAALAETEGGTSVGALDWLASLSVDLWQRVPVYMRCLPACAALAATARRFRGVAWSPHVWEDAVIELRPAAFDSALELLVGLACECWGRAKELILPAHPVRRMFLERLRAAWHGRLDAKPVLSVRGDGPYMIYAMSTQAVILREQFQLNFSEPQYCWMRTRWMEAPEGERPKAFAWVLSKRVYPGAAGYLCEVVEWQRNHDSTWDAAVRKTPAFSLEESYPESVPGFPGASPLNVGYIQLVPRHQDVDERSVESYSCEAEGSEEEDDESEPGGASTP